MDISLFVWWTSLAEWFLLKNNHVSNLKKKQKWKLNIRSNFWLNWGLWDATASAWLYIVAFWPRRKQGCQSTLTSLAVYRNGFSIIICHHCAKRMVMIHDDYCSWWWWWWSWCLVTKKKNIIMMLMMMMMMLMMIMKVMTAAIDILIHETPRLSLNNRDFVSVMWHAPQIKHSLKGVDLLQKAMFYDFLLFVVGNAPLLGLWKEVVSQLARMFRLQYEAVLDDKIYFPGGWIYIYLYICIWFMWANYNHLTRYDLNR